MDGRGGRELEGEKGGIAGILLICSSSCRWSSVEWRSCSIVNCEALPIVDRLPGPFAWYCAGEPLRQLPVIATGKRSRDRETARWGDDVRVGERWVWRREGRLVTAGRRRTDERNAAVALAEIWWCAALRLSLGSWIVAL